MAKKTGTTKKVTRKSLAGGQATHYKEALSIVTNNLFASADDFREYLDKNATFQMKKGPTVQFWKDNEKVAKKFEMLAQVGGLGKYDDLLKDMQALNASLPKGTNLQRDHAELSPFGVRINTLVQKLQNMKLQKSAIQGGGGIGQAKYEAQSLPPQSGRVRTQGTPTIPLSRDLDPMIQDLKELAAAEDALTKYYEGTEMTPGNLEIWINKLKDKNTGEITLHKRKKITGSQSDYEEIRFTEKNLHDHKSYGQRLLGSMASDILYGKVSDTKKMPKKDKDAVRKILKNQVLHIKGSGSLYEAYRDGYFDLFEGKKKFKKVQSGSKVTLSRKKKANFRKAEAELRKIAIAAGKARAAWKEAQTASHRKKETKHGNIAQGLIGIQSKVNRKLPTELRRNMVRPALMNRTGRFSNSVVLASLKPSLSGKTIRADYTYMLNPYATFENMGQREWPIGYNPKPLISKSIKNLAEAEIREKFGIGITTRRI